MDVRKASLLAIFDAKQRLEVPVFQRQYVWGEEQPLWEDIERKFFEALEGLKDAPKHFLGAMVLDQKRLIGPRPLWSFHAEYPSRPLTKR